VCKVLKIEIHRPVKGLLCIEDQYAKVLDYLYMNYHNPSGRNTKQVIMNVLGVNL
jgi:hypothetical protein